jgi:hypothetical protein
METGRDKRFWRGGQKRDAAPNLVGRLRHVVAVEPNHLTGLRARPQQQAAGENRPHRVQAEQELGDDPEVTAATAQAPEQVRVLRGGRGHHSAVGGDHLRRQQALAREAIHSLQPAAPAAQREAADAGVGHPATGHGQPVLLGGGIELSPDSAPLNTRGSGLRIDLNPVHRPEIDHDPCVAGAVSGR